MHYETLKALLKKNGASLTRPRRVVFDLLLDQEPQSMQVLTKRTEGKADRATVYRVIELYERLGIVHRLNIGWKYKIELTDIFAEHHHHFYCTNCGRTYSLPGNNMLETMIASAASKEGFSPRGHQLEIYGLCSSCQKV
ncbi:MAG TPA: Fur family transcriptional regulator [Candidatus Saccharimonadales bacterium]|nr:Fur family transcriptional regulator [Candidatus Saccharimonadales bacterium]